MKFEEFLQQKHAEQYRGTDDDMAEDFENWLIDQDIQQMIDYADEWNNNLKVGILDRFIQFLSNDVGVVVDNDEANQRYAQLHGYYQEQLDNFLKEQE